MCPLPQIQKSNSLWLFFQLSSSFLPGHAHLTLFSIHLQLLMSYLLHQLQGCTHVCTTQNIQSHLIQGYFHLVQQSYIQTKCHLALKDLLIGLISLIYQPQCLSSTCALSDDAIVFNKSYEIICFGCFTFININKKGMSKELQGNGCVLLTRFV